MSLSIAVVDAGTALEEAGGLLRYALVFLLAMVPAVEPFAVIPIAIGLGFDPVATGVAAFAGSVTAVYLLVAFQDRLLALWRRRSGDDGSTSSGRPERARRVWERYGLVAFAFVGPILAGIHLAALIAVTVDGRPRRVAVWLTVGLGAWTVALVVGSVAGLSALGLA
ncbi:small multi-drug export protein [Natronococcus roseus]|uniref:small multi-drug export protein n=1 Tax=Natronococcus roseus TaxID=1052014 RepID=UPI00374CCF87